MVASGSSPGSDAPREERSYQFGMRAITGITVSVAVVAAALAPGLRKLEWDQALGISILWGVVIVLAVLMFMGLGWNHRRNEQKAGEVRFVLNCPGLEGLTWICLSSGFVALFVSTVLIDTRAFRNPSSLTANENYLEFVPWQFMLVATVVAGVLLGVGFSALRGPFERIQLRDHGMILGGHFEPFGKTSQIRWCWKDQQLRLWGSSGIGLDEYEAMRVDVPNAFRDAVEHYLCDRLGPETKLA